MRDAIIERSTGNASNDRYPNTVDESHPPRPIMYRATGLFRGIAHVRISRIAAYA